MWALVFIFTVIVRVVFGIPEIPGIKREISDGVQSLGFKVIYGNEDMTVINQVITNAEKDNVLKSTVNLNEAIKPLPAEDVKCLMSVDRYCSKKMGAMKSK